MALAATLISPWYKSLINSRVLVLTGAGASVPLGMPAMDHFQDLLQKPAHDLLATFAPPQGKSGWNDLEELLGQLTFYESILSRRGLDANLQRWLTLTGSRNLGSDAQNLKADIFEAIVGRLGVLDEEAAEKAVSIYPNLYNGLLEVCAAIRQCCRYSRRIMTSHLKHFEIV